MPPKAAMAALTSSSGSPLRATAISGWGTGSVASIVGEDAGASTASDGIAEGTDVGGGITVLVGKPISSGLVASEHAARNLPPATAPSCIANQRRKTRRFGLVMKPTSFSHTHQVCHLFAT